MIKRNRISFLLLIFFFTLVLFSFSSCVLINDDPDDYHVKYVVTIEDSDNPITSQIVFYGYVNFLGQNNLYAETLSENSWELTFGPARRGYYAWIQAGNYSIRDNDDIIFYDEANYPVEVRIYVSKNYLPFELKAINIFHGEVKTTRYTIDF